VLKTILISFGVLVVVIAFYLCWIISQAAKAAEEKVFIDVHVSANQIVITATLTGTNREYEVKEIVVSREWGEAIGIMPPDGFSEQGYTFEDASSLEDLEARAWVEATNAEQIRLVGALNLAPGTAVTFHFPISGAPPRTSTIRFQYEGRLGIGGSIAFFNADVQKTEI